MAASHFGMPAPEQCTLASEFIPGAVACCIDGSTDACDQSLDAAAIPALYKAVILFADALGSDALASGLASVFFDHVVVRRNHDGVDDR